MPVSAPADRRFRRARVSPARRSPSRRVWRKGLGIAVVLTAASYACAALVEVAAGSPALTVTRISVSGHSRVSAGDVHALLEGLEGSSLLTLDLASWRRTLLASPWIADADIRRVFPGAVAVVLSEREPAAIGRVDGALYVVDDSGTIIEEFGPNQADLDLPIVDGLATARSGALLLDEPRARLAARLLSALQPYPELAARVSQIDVTDVHGAVVVLKGDTAQVRVGTERFAERLRSYVELAPYLRERVPDIDYVDLRYGDRVYVRPQDAAPPGEGRRG